MRTTAGGLAYHVRNRANARIRIFKKPTDYEAFERILEQAADREAMRVLAYCRLPSR